MSAAYNACEGPPIPVKASGNAFNHSMPILSVVFVFIFTISVIVSLAQKSNAWVGSIYMLFLIPLYCLYGNYIPSEVKKAKDGTLFIKFRTLGVKQLSNPVVRPPEEHELDPKGCNAKGVSWCAQRDVETSILLEGDVQVACWTQRQFFVLPKNDELAKLSVAAASAV